MPDLLTALPKPEPDVERLKTVLRRGKPDRVPLIELMIADEVLSALAGRALVPLPEKPDPAQLRAWAADRVELWRRLEIGRAHV